jgi:hypothetical protein
VVSRTFSTSGFSFASYSPITVFAAVEALHYLELWEESFWLIIDVVDVASICDAFICCVVVVEIDHNRVVFRFDGGFFVFVSKKIDFGDGSAREAIGGFEQLDSFGIVQIQFVNGYAMNDDSIVWLMRFDSFKGFAPIKGAKLPCLFFCCTAYADAVNNFVDSL